MSVLSDLGISAGSTIGVGYLGCVISSMLYGVTCVQTFYYFRSSSKDHWMLKALVLSLLAHQAVITHIWYHYLIINYANPISLIMSVWLYPRRSISCEVILNAVIAFLVETFLVLRIWRLGKNAIVAGVCELFTVGHLVMNLLFPIRGLLIPDLMEAEVKLKSTGSAGLGVALVTDILISASLSYYLSTSRTGFRRSDNMIDKLIALTVTTGSLTTTFVAANLIAYLTAPRSLYVLFFNFMLGKLYINIILTSLNARSAIRQDNTEGDSKLINSIPLHHIEAPSESYDGKAINISVETQVQNDSSLPMIGKNRL